jgi:hypothetical protein
MSPINEILGTGVRQGGTLAVRTQRPPHTDPEQSADQPESSIELLVKLFDCLQVAYKELTLRLCLCYANAFLVLRPVWIDRKTLLSRRESPLGKGSELLISGRKLLQLAQEEGRENRREHGTRNHEGLLVEGYKRSRPNLADQLPAWSTSPS